LVFLGFHALGGTRSSAALLLAVNPLSLEFIGGCFIARIYYSGFRQYAYPALVTGIIMLVLAFTYHSYVSPISNETAGWSRILLFGLPDALIVYGVLSTSAPLEGFISRILLSLGNASYSLYLSHALVVSGIGNFWKMFSLQNHVGNLFFILLMLGASILTVISVNYNFPSGDLIVAHHSQAY